MNSLHVIHHPKKLDVGHLFTSKVVKASTFHNNLFCQLSCENNGVGAERSCNII